MVIKDGNAHVARVAMFASRGSKYVAGTAIAVSSGATQLKNLTVFIDWREGFGGR